MMDMVIRDLSVIRIPKWNGRRKYDTFIELSRRDQSPSPPEIDDNDTDPRPLSYSDSELDREQKLNYIKKYALRKKIKIPKFPRGTFQKE